jgi:hypothetical protein
MVKISIEVRSGAARFDVAVQAESIQGAVSLVQERYSKGSVKVKCPIKSESFVEGPAARSRIVGPEHPARAAA